MISREEARLRGLIRKLVIVSLAGATAGCSTSDPASAASSAPGPDAARAGEADATTGTPTADASTSGATDAGDAGGGGDASDAAACAAHLLDGSPADFPDADPTTAACVWFSSVPCGLPSDTTHDGCSLVLTTCREVCAATSRCNVYECGDAGTIPSGAVRVECINNGPKCTGVVGRRPDGLRDPRRRCGGDAVGEWLADNARLEAASVHAFRRLGAELTDFGAPVALVHAAERSARDEVRHARVTKKLARRRGAEPARVVVKQSGRRRSLEAFAFENAVEGCIRETFGALVATRQARAAVDPELRRAMVEIAEDETRHAALAWAVAGWTKARLDAEARGRVEAAMLCAVDALRCEVRAMPAALALELGLPSGAAGARLVDAFAREVGIG